MNWIFMLLVVTTEYHFTNANFGASLTSKYLKYLQDKGYLAPPNPYIGALKSQSEIIDSLKRLQEFAGIPVTGKIDDATILKFNQPRCGMKDIISKKQRYKRYVLQGNKWNKKVLTYRIENYSSDLQRKHIRQTIRRAFTQWERVTQLRFYEKKNGIADIMIKFTRKSHSDPYPFDGPGGTLAHAFYPGFHELAGDTHFDEDETFTLKSKHGKNFYWVALHEFGHAVGLEHSSIRNAIMYPWYEGYTGEQIDLTEDDKKGVQALYGKPNGEDDPIFSEKPQNNCLTRAKVVLPGDNSETIVINDDKVYIFDKNLAMLDGPTPLKKYYPGLTNVDAAFKQRNGRVIFLRGSYYWEYSGRKLIHGPIHVHVIGFNKEMYDLKAAFRWSRNGKVYFFKGPLYWRYDNQRHRVDSGYPKSTKKGWIGVPVHFDSAFQWHNKQLYFFKGGSYYRYNDRRFEVHKNYPLAIEHFFTCYKTPRLALLKDERAMMISASSIVSTNMFVTIMLSFVGVILLLFRF